MAEKYFFMKDDTKDVTTNGTVSVDSNKEIRVDIDVSHKADPWEAGVGMYATTRGERGGHVRGTYQEGNFKAGALFHGNNRDQLEGRLGFEYKF